MWSRSRREIANQNRRSGDIMPLLAPADDFQSNDLNLKLAMLQCKRQLLELENSMPRRPLLSTPSQYSFRQPPQSYSPPAGNSQFFKGSPGALLQAPGSKRPAPSPWDDFPQDRYDGPSWPKKPANQRPSLINQPPSLMGPAPSLLGEPPRMDQSPPRMVPPPLMSQTPRIGKPLPLMSQTPQIGKPPSLMGQPPSLMSQPLPLMGQLPSLMSRFTPRMGRTPYLMDQPRPPMRRPPPLTSKLNPKPNNAAKPKQGNTVSGTKNKTKEPSVLNESSSKTVAWVEQGVGSILRDMKKNSLGSAEPYIATFKSDACERALKLNIRERLRAIILGKTLNTCAEIVPLYRNEYPEETDVELLSKTWEAHKQRGDLIIGIIQKDNPEIYFKNNFNRVLDAKLNEMFSWIAERYKDIPECNKTAQAIIDECLLEVAKVDASDMSVEELKDIADNSEPKCPERLTARYYKNLLNSLLQRNMPVLLLKYKKVMESIFTADEAYRETMGFLIETTKEKLEKCQSTPSNSEELEKCQSTPSNSEELEKCQSTPSNSEELEKCQSTPSNSEELEKCQSTPSNSEELEKCQSTPSNSKKTQNTTSDSKKEISKNTPSDSKKEISQNTPSDSKKEISQNTPSDSKKEISQKCQNTPSNSKNLEKHQNAQSNSEKEKCQNTASTSKKEIVHNTRSNSAKEKCQNTPSNSKEIIQNTPSTPKKEIVQNTPPTSKKGIVQNTPPTSKKGIVQNTPSNTTPTCEDPVKKDDWFVKIVACPTLPDPNQMKKFLNPFNPVSIRKHKSMANTLFVKFGTEKDYINIIDQTEVVVGTSTLDIKAGPMNNKLQAKKNKSSDQLNVSQAKED